MFKRYWQMLLDWLGKFFNKAKEVKATEPIDRIDYYHPGERQLFTYWDGEKDVFCDPIVLYRKVMQARKSILVDGDAIIPSMQGDGKLFCGMISKARELFNLKPYEEGGLTELEVIQLINRFISYTDGIQGLPIGPVDNPTPKQPTSDMNSTSEPKQEEPSNVPNFTDPNIPIPPPTRTPTAAEYNPEPIQ